MGKDLLDDALKAFDELARDLHAGRDSDAKFIRYAQDDPPMRVRTLAIAGALLTAGSTEQVAGTVGPDGFWYIDGDAEKSLAANDMAAMRLYIAALNDDPEHAFALLFAHEETHGVDALMQTIRILMSMYVAMVDEVPS